MLDRALGVDCAICFLPRIKGMKALILCRLKQVGAGGDKDDLGSLKHIARNQRRAQLQSIRPADMGAIEKLARGFKHSGIEGLLHHARCLEAKNVEGRGCILRRDLAGPLTPPHRRINLKRRGCGDELAIVLDGIHELNQRVRPTLLYKQLGECR